MEVRPQLQNTLMPLSLFPYRIAHVRVDLKHERYNQVKENKYSYQPEGNEINPWPDTTSDIAEHVAGDLPIIHYHYLEQRHHARAEVIEIHKVV
jgi:hypothetical protein